MTNGMPAFDGSPSSTAIWAPAGSDAGPGPHLISDGARATALAIAGFAAAAAAGFFGVWAFGAAAVAIAAATAISVVRTMDMNVSLLKRLKTVRIIVQGSGLRLEVAPLFYAKL